MAAPVRTDLPADYRPWPALWAMVLGFFMILVDSTIVSVATPAIMRGLDADVNAVIWVTSAYLLAYAVPLLITGRLGDRFGPKNLYLVGLTVFTVASLWCGLTGNIEQLIIARVLQGFGASLMTPQTMAVITRVFPRESRGSAMSLWGATAGVATLVGPLLGGVLVDAAGWEWIFFINIPIGVVGLWLAWRLVPDLEVHEHEAVALIGASGSGKSTILRCIDLLTEIDDGDILLDGEVITDPSVEAVAVRRRLGTSTSDFLHSDRRNVVAYLLAWAALLEERLQSALGSSAAVLRRVTPWDEWAADGALPAAAE